MADTKTMSPSKVMGIRAGMGLLGLAAIALLAPLVWAAVSAGVGLLVLLVVAGLGIGLFQALPLFGQKWENKVLAERKAEARENPIEQLQNFLMEKMKRVDVFKQAVVAIATQIKGLAEMLRERKRVKPNGDYTRQEEALNQMNAAHSVLVDRYKNAEQAIHELRDIIDDKKFEWSFGQAGQLAIAQLNAASGEELLNQILADEAFASVRDNFNKVFAELEIEATRLTDTKQLTFEGGMTLDLSAIRIPERVPA